MNDQDLLEIAIKAAIAGGIEILDVYGHDFNVEFKEDRSPLTLADKRSHEAICEILEETGLPILSEEGKSIPFETRKNWKRFWMVDPLDGTKEFVKRNGEFTVNIALIDENRAEIGVIYVPVSGWLYFASESTGAMKTLVSGNEKDTIEKLITTANKLPGNDFNSRLIVVCSRSHMSNETSDYIQRLRDSGHDLDFVSIGSSLKMCLVAEGKAHIYPRFGPTMEWDTAAGQAIVEKSGGKVLKTDSPEQVRYNKADLLNPWFIASRIISKTPAQ